MILYDHFLESMFILQILVIFNNILVLTGKWFVPCTCGLEMFIVIQQIENKSSGLSFMIKTLVLNFNLINVFSPVFWDIFRPFLPWNMTFCIGALRTFVLKFFVTKTGTTEYLFTFRVCAFSWINDCKSETNYTFIIDLAYFVYNFIVFLIQFKNWRVILTLKHRL